MVDSPTFMNVEDLIRDIATQFDGAELFYGHGTDNALDEAAWLVFSVLNLSHEAAPAVYAGEVTNEQRAAALDIARRRMSAQKPLAYLLNEAWFAGLQFYVDERVLVPRSPLSELIAAEFLPWLPSGGAKRLADLGTGSGCIAIALATAFPDAVVDAVDISQEALDVANINVDRHQLHSRVNLLRSDFFDALHGRRYDLIVSNPPYVDEQDMNSRPQEFHHEPALGLAAGEDGLDAVHKILRDAAGFLTDNGILVCEVGNSKAALEAAYPDLPFLWLDFEHGGEGVFLLSKNDLI